MLIQFNKILSDKVNTFNIPGRMVEVHNYLNNKSIEVKTLDCPLMDLLGQYSEPFSIIMEILDPRGERVYVEWNDKEERWEFMDGYN